MGEIQLAAQCDNCYKKTLDYMADGWTTIQGELIKYNGRNNHGMARTEIFWQSPGSWHSSKKFLCSLECLLGNKKVL